MKLELAINPNGWMVFRRRRADKAFRPMRDRVFNRDRYACRFCGFTALEYQEVINLDGDYSNNKFENMATSCCLCAQALFVDQVGVGGFGGGKLIYLPEIDQEALNGLCHVLFCAMSNGSSYMDTAQNIYRNFKFRSQPIEDKYGINTSNPSFFGQMLVETGNVAQSAKVLKNIKVLPIYTKFRRQLECWARAAAKELEARKQKEK
jgi:intracellular multiplication protein IcmJ